MPRRVRRGRPGWSSAAHSEGAVQLPEEFDREETVDEPEVEAPRRSARRRRSEIERIPEPTNRARGGPRRLKVLSVVLVLAGIGFAGLGVVRPWVARSVTTSYTTSTVTWGDITASSVATGTIAASTVYGLRFGANPDIVTSSSTTSGTGGTVNGGSTTSSNLSWPVETVSVSEGQKVIKGDVLAVADDTAAQLALLSAKADLASAQARLDSDEGSGRASEATLLGDQVQVAKAQAASKAAMTAVERATIVAPADGLVLSVNILTAVDAPSGYAIEMSSGAMVATASFAESDISSLAVGQAASVSVTALDATVVGIVASIATAADSGGSMSSSVVSYKVRVTLTDPPSTVRAGMSSTITITTASVTDVLRVPATAVTGTSATGYTVRVVDSDGVVSTEVVGIGLVTSSFVEITSGLWSGETVVTGTSAKRNGTTTTTGGMNLPVGPGILGR
jgi:membrane fusion protein, macrolide-specific efflux system